MKVMFRIALLLLCSVPPTNAQSITAKFINGIPQADQFTGSPTNDFCGKLYAAETYALLNNINKVDATHFSNIQTCNSDPFHLLGGSAGATVNLEVDLPAAVITFTHLIQIDDTGIRIHGASRGSTVWAWNGTATMAGQAFMTVGGDSQDPGTELVDLENFSVIGLAASGNLGAAMLLEGDHRSKLVNMSFWGATTGLETEGAVSDSYDNIHVSNIDATLYSWSGLFPVHGIFLSGGGSNQTTAGVFRGVVVEGVTGNGIELASTANMVFEGGTSENNPTGIGIKVDTGSKWNSFIGMDIEGNHEVAGGDVTDVGQSNWYINGLYATPCSGCASMSAGGGGGQWILGDAGPITGWTGSFSILGNNPNFSAGSGITTVSGLSVGRSVSNQGLQVIQGSACTISTGAIGNYCPLTLTFTSTGGVAEPDNAYKATCQGYGGTNNWSVGNITGQTATTLSLNLVALSTNGNSQAGVVNCVLMHY